MYFGGTFERVLKRLEEQGAIQRENRGKRKSSKIPMETLIHLNISKIQNLFDEKRRLFNIANQPDMRLEEEHELEADKWEMIVRKKLLFLFESTRKLWNNLGDKKLREVDSISEDAAYQLATNILTRVFNVRIKPSKSKQWELTEDEVWELATLTAKIASRNLTQPFTLTIDYSGYSMESPLWMKNAISKISPYIVKYADVNNFKLTAEEIENISEGRIPLLRPSLRTLVDIFWKNHVIPILNDALAALNFIDTKTTSDGNSTTR